MHLLAAQPGTVDDGAEAIDLGQSPGDIVFLTAADSEIACLSAAQHRRLDDDASTPSLRLANLMQLGHNLSVDLYVEDVVSQASLVIVRVLGGRGYWPYGIERLTACCRKNGIALALLPGDDQPDPELQGLSTLPQQQAHRILQYCSQGGSENAINLLRYAATLIDVDAEGDGADTSRWSEPVGLLRAGLYWPEITQPGLQDLPQQPGWPTAILTFYRSLLQAGNTAVIDALIASLRQQNLNTIPLYVASLKDPIADALIREVVETAAPDIVLNATGFSLAAPGAKPADSPFAATDCPVLQVVFSGGNEASWRTGTRGLGARDIAMNVALPEIDGRILSRAVSFKGRQARDKLTQTDIVEYVPILDRCDFVAGLAASWCRLRRKPRADRHIALIMANYPNRDGRIGNGVGLDTPASIITTLHTLQDAGYNVNNIPENGDGLIQRLIDGPTNAAVAGRRVTEMLPLSDYETHFSALPKIIRDQVTERWGHPAADPLFRPGRTDCGAFAIPALRFGNITVGLQPARGYNIDPQSSYHDPALVPPHGYFAFYTWIRHEFRADAVVHMGKHGNLEWLPGKAVALSETCFPEAVFGPTPHLYPFIVNDPGEGTQAKRRAQAVIIDHLTPPMTRAESYGPLKDLEQLVDEYYEAAGVDPRRLKLLSKQIMELAQSSGLDKDCGVARDAGEAETLTAIDNFLCELKEMQIRDGLHIFGETPQDDLLCDLIVALVRAPRGAGEGEASLIRALADDLDLGFDPLDCVMSDPWNGPRPDCLCQVDSDAEALWRTAGDTVERLEGLACSIVGGETPAANGGERTVSVMKTVNEQIRPAVEACAAGEINGILTGLDGRFVMPGPSGAPTRGRPDVLPTGKNFFSVDTRVLPTPAAWQLGWKSAQMFVERYAQDNGHWPTSLAISAWGTSNMRTGGDDIAQALALIGARPTWDPASRRVTGFEVLPLDILNRSRVDVTLRISGFFRDAFGNLIDLFDSAVRAVAALDEGSRDNPLAHEVSRETERLVEQGTDGDDARIQAASRVFGSQPGAYGAGLQALIDEHGWESDADLARAYVAWGGYVYGNGQEGAPAHRHFETRLARIDAVIQNQDNREHDLLDSDDYYQFEGGMTAAVRVLSGQQPRVYHNDHSLPTRPRIRSLQEEVARVVRARVVNPKWINGVMRHGYKGAFEMAATVDYLFAFAATARCIEDHHFDAVFDAYLMDDVVQQFIERHNPAALAEMAARLKEAQDRELWRPRSNLSYRMLETLANTASSSIEKEPVL